MAPQDAFHYEVEYSEVDASEDLDPRGRKVTTVKCHGRLIAENRQEIEDIFKNTDFHGRIIIDLGDVNYMDSSGLGALIKLRLSAAKHSGVSVHFEHMTPRIMQILRIANLADWFSS